MAGPDQDPDPVDPRIGRVLDNRYRIVEPIAQGGMGSVYRGERVKLERGVAIKFLHAWAVADASFIKRFELEARAMAKLQHPNCAAVIDFGVEGHEPYVIMDLVAGVSLGRLLEDGPLPAPRAVDIARQVLAGLAHAHRHGIIHRDVKPENIMVEATDLGDHVRMLDFGLAKMMSETSGNLTGAMVVGTPSYMSPEQSRGDPVDAKADVYGVGVVLFEMLTGAKPFQGEDAGETMRMHREEPPPRLIDRAPGVAFSTALEAVLVRALAKSTVDRYSAAELAVALDEVADRPPRVPSAAELPVRATMVLDAAELIPLTTALAAPTAPGATPPPRPLAPPRSTAPPAPGALAAGPPVDPARTQTPPASWTTAPAPATQARPGQIARALAGARERWWLVAAGGLAGLALIVVIVILVGGDGAPAAGPADAREADEIEMPVDERPGPPAELEALRARVRGASTPQSVVQALQRLGSAHPTSAEIPLVLGQIYFDRLWVDDGLEQFRRAIRIDAALREDPALIRAALNGLGNDSHHPKVRRFLARDVGAPARRFLEGVATGNWRREVKERAAATLRDLGP